MRDLIIYILEMFHVVVAVFLIIGGYVIPNKYIPVFLLCSPYLVIDWNDTDGFCWITKLRNMIKSWKSAQYSSTKLPILIYQ